MTSYLCENEAQNFQNGNFHLSQMPDFWNEISLEPFGALKSVRAPFFAFFPLSLELNLLF